MNITKNMTTLRDYVIDQLHDKKLHRRIFSWGTISLRDDTAYMVTVCGDTSGNRYEVFIVDTSSKVVECRVIGNTHNTMAKNLHESTDPHIVTDIGNFVFPILREETAHLLYDQKTLPLEDFITV
jgi:hypothetical protein